MLNSMTTLEKYIWIVNQLYRAKDRGLSLSELNERWVRNTDLSKGEDLQRQKFDRWKKSILTTFGISIECKVRGGYRYYIANREEIDSGTVNRWILDAYSTVSLLSQHAKQNRRILVEDVPSSHDYLEQIIEAMNDNQVIKIRYQGFQKHKAFTFPVEPYCVKMFQRRWYLLAHSIGDDTMRLYALDRIDKVEQTDKHFELPKDFDAKEYFSTFFGIVTHEHVPIQRILLRANKYHKHYLRTLPLHDSQKEISDDGEDAVFEVTLRPTYDFCMELLRVGNMIEILEPQSMRHVMHNWTKDVWELYKND